MLEIHGNYMVVGIIEEMFGSGIDHIVFDVSVCWSNRFSPITNAFIILNEIYNPILIDCNSVLGQFVDIKKNDRI